MTASNPTAPPPDPGPTPEAPASRRLAADGPVMRRTAGDVLLGLVLIVTGVVVLGDVVLASVISVLFLGWTALVGGVVAVVLAVLRRDGGSFWIGVIGGAMSAVAGLVFIRNPGVTLVALSLVVGALLLVGGVTRILAAFQATEQRAVLAVAGVVSIVLGLMILNRWPSSALWLLGTLLGVQLIVDGLLLMVLGRLRPPRGKAAA